MKVKDKPEFSPEFLEIIALLEQVPAKDPKDPQEGVQVTELEAVCA